MANESRFTEDVWNSWLEPIQAVRMLMDAGLDDREHAVNWLKARLRNGDLQAGGWHFKFPDEESDKPNLVIGRYKVTTWDRVAAIPWKDDFWISGVYQPDGDDDDISHGIRFAPREFAPRELERKRFPHDLIQVRLDPEPIAAFCERARKPRAELNPQAALPNRAKGGRPRKPFWDQLWASVAAQLYNGDLKPARQADIERAMHEWLAANGEDAGETAVRAKAKLLWAAIDMEVEN